MRVLAMETTEAAGTVALLAGGNLLAERSLGCEKRSAATLAPAVESLLKQEGWRPRDVQLVAVGIGPGSFTGLRVGTAMAKVFAYAAGAEVLGIETLEAVAARLPADVRCAAACIDAQRGDLVGQQFHRVDGGLVAAGPRQLCAAEAWFASLSAEIVLTGPGLRRHGERIPAGRTLAPEALWAPRASVVGRLAAEKYAAGVRGDPWTLLPIYSRPSAAEEKRMRATGSSRTPADAPRCR